MGRPMKLTRATADQIAAALTNGATRAAACRQAGIDPATLRRYLNDPTPPPEHLALRRAVAGAYEQRRAIADIYWMATVYRVDVIGLVIPFLDGPIPRDVAAVHAQVRDLLDVGEGPHG